VTILEVSKLRPDPHCRSRPSGGRPQGTLIHRVSWSVLRPLRALCHHLHLLLNLKGSHLCQSLSPIPMRTMILGTSSPLARLFSSHLLHSRSRSRSHNLRQAVPPSSPWRSQHRLFHSARNCHKSPRSSPQLLHFFRRYRPYFHYRRIAF
jgi:hypothetical protein